MTGRFDSAAELPRTFAPASDPYGGTHLERSADLKVESKGGRTVYTFERVYHRRDPLFRFIETEMEELFNEGIPESIRKRLVDEPSLSAEDWELVGTVFREGWRFAGEVFAREALTALYSEGDASLSLEGRRRIVGRTADATAAVVKTEVFTEFMRAEGREDRPSPFDTIEERGLEAMRQAFTAGLDAEGVAWGVRNAVLERLERLIAGSYHSSDLRDESFAVKVRMPGVIIGGNFHEASAQVASWEFEGEGLLDGSAILRVVSVVE